MVPSNDTTVTGLGQAIERYEVALTEIESAVPNLSETQALKVLLARDAVEELLQEKTKASETEIISLIELDERLKKQCQAIAASLDVALCREKLKPPESSWWWLFTLPQQTAPWDRLDWLWNLLSAAALALAGSYVLITLQAFAVGGLGIAEAFGTIAQATGLALLGQGLVGQDESKLMTKLLYRIGIPPKLQSEARFVG